MKNIKFLALGGMDEQGKNFYSIDIDGSVFLMDAGSKDPTFNSFGVDLVIPDFTFIQNNLEKIKGIFISHGHPDQIGALPYLTKRFPNIEIYANGITTSIIEHEFRKMKITKYKINKIDTNKDLKFGNVTIKTFQLSHNFPNTIGFALISGGKQVVYATDFFIDAQNKNLEYATDYAKITKIASESKTELLITDSTNSRFKGHTLGKTDGYIKGFKKALKTGKQRLIVGVFTENLKSIHEMINISVKLNKRIAFYGKDLNEILKFMDSEKLLDVPTHNVVSFDKINEYDDCVIFVAHTSYQLYRKLSGIAHGIDEIIKLKKTDDVYVAARPIDGAETFYYKIIDDLYRAGVRATYVSKTESLGFHASEEDIKHMINLFNPKSLIPIKGNFRDFMATEKIAIDMGIKPEFVTLLDNGEVCELSDLELKILKPKIEAKDNYVDGLGVGDVGEMIIRERERMGDGGTIFIGILIDNKTKQLISPVTFENLGLTDNQEGIAEVEKRILTAIEDVLPAEKDIPNWNIREAKIAIRKKGNNAARKVLNKEPAVVPIIIEIRK